MDWFKWIVLIFALFLLNVGFTWTTIVVVSSCFFLIGFASLLFIKQGNANAFYLKCASNPLETDDSTTTVGGLCGPVNRIHVNKRKVRPRRDTRVTGSDLIDSALQEILAFVIRDYVCNWYNTVSLDTEFPQSSVQSTIQSCAVTLSNCVKDVDWIPYLTTNLVDDAATHLRLFKQARNKQQPQTQVDNSAVRSPRGSPRREVKVTASSGGGTTTSSTSSGGSPMRSHKRNKSETDVHKYGISRNNDKSMGNSRFQANTFGGKKSAGAVAVLEDHFFDLECTMEKNQLCRDAVCVDYGKEKEFLTELVEMVLFVLMPEQDFTCMPLRVLVREIISNSVLLPVFTLISDPDFINQAIIWLCLRDAPLPSDVFLITLRITDNGDELRHTKEIVDKEIQQLRSRDSGGESDLAIKQQLSSLNYVQKIIDNRLLKINSGESPTQIPDSKTLESIKSVDLPLEVILKNNVALSYFIDFVSSQLKQSYLFFYLNIEGWKVSVEQQLSDIHLSKITNTGIVYDNIRSTALSIYEQYLCDGKDQSKVDLNASLAHKLYFKIKNHTETPSELWFDDVQSAIYEILQTRQEFLPSFKKSNAYLKLLEELDLLQFHITEEDSASVSSLELEERNTGTDSYLKPELATNGSLVGAAQLQYLTVENDSERFVKHARSLSDVTDFSTKCVKDCEIECKKDVTEGKSVDNSQQQLRSGDYALVVDIIETGIVCEKGKTFGIYATHVMRQFESGFLEQWHIYRRYSDFYDLHSKVKDRFPDLSKLIFPGKKTFHNMDRAVLEKRMRMLGQYLQALCQSSVINAHPGLRDMLILFLEQGEYDRVTSGGPISNTIDTIKSGMRTIKNMPEQIVNTVDEVVEGLNKVFHTKSGLKTQEAIKVGAALDIESDDNIPLRIILLLMDEVFDLKSRNQWLRRRIITLLRQIVRTMFGDIVNRRILHYVSLMTSPKNVAYYLETMKQTFWPNGVKVEQGPQRGEEIKSRTRIAAKIALLSCLSDELKHIIGSETTRKGLLTIFELFQRPILNRRLLYVLLEGVLTTLFRDKDMAEIFKKLYSNSPRCQDSTGSNR